jgi:hypothetical protein
LERWNGFRCFCSCAVMGEWVYCGRDALGAFVSGAVILAGVWIL